jgi:hypothetical protein
MGSDAIGPNAPAFKISPEDITDIPAILIRALGLSGWVRTIELVFFRFITQKTS